MLTRKQIEKKGAETTPVYNATIGVKVKMVNSRRFVFEPFSYTEVDDNLIESLEAMLENEKIGCFICFGDEDFEAKRIECLKNYVSEYGLLNRTLKHWQSREEEEKAGGRIFTKPKAYLDLEKERKELLKYLDMVVPEEKKLSYLDFEKIKNKNYQNDNNLDEISSDFDMIEDQDDDDLISNQINDGTPRKRGRPSKD